MSEANSKQKPCVHYLILDSADSNTGFSRCRRYGVVLEFSNDWSKPASIGPILSMIKMLGMTSDNGC